AAGGGVVPFSKTSSKNEDFFQLVRQTDGLTDRRVSWIFLFGKVNLPAAMKQLSFFWRILSRTIYEAATDNTTGLAAQMAYQFLLVLAPGLFFLWHLLGLFGTDPARLHQMFEILRSFLPPDPKVQDILDATVGSVVLTGPTGMVANIGIVVGIYFGT